MAGVAAMRNEAELVPLALERTCESVSGSTPEAADEDPPFGAISMAGRSRDMEDAIAVIPRFAPSDLHFFAVFDGHGGSHIALLCKEKMHVFLAEELKTEMDGRDGTAPLDEERWTAAMRRCFKRMDEQALEACDRGVGSEFVGTTAVAAVVSGDRVVVANCGDSRAVLCRGEAALPLSFDHKPDRPDEKARIEAAGGRVLYSDSARVLGILAMSRAIGDKYLKPIVISEPEVIIQDRTPEDECLILASDGLWDVISNQLACDIARRCLLEASSQRDGDTAPCELQALNSRCMLAAAMLARLALCRKSSDNISVIVVDLRRGGT